MSQARYGPLPPVVVTFEGRQHVLERVLLDNLEEWGREHQVKAVCRVGLEGYPTWPPIILYERITEGPTCPVVEPGRRGSGPGRASHPVDTAGVRGG